MSMYGLMVTSSGWDWYQSSIAPHLTTNYHITASTIGLILLSPGLSYILASPLCGFILDRLDLKIWSQVLGTTLICVGYIIFGPIPQIDHIKTIEFTVLGLAVQGVGFGFAYIGIKESLYHHQPY